jgi:hypothetical protein
MEPNQKPPTPRERFKRLFKRTPQHPETRSIIPHPETRSIIPVAAIRSLTTEAQYLQTPSITAARSDWIKVEDRLRTRDRHIEASKLLQDTVKAHQHLGDFDFPELSGEPEDENALNFKEKINGVLQSRKHSTKDLSMWKKCENAVQGAFVAFSPFAVEFLAIAAEGKAVMNQSR